MRSTESTPESDDMRETVEELPEGKVPVQPANPGEHLRRAREQRALNRARLGQSVGLTGAAIKNLENNHFDHFPSAVYVRGYLKSCARMLGEDEGDITAEFDRYCEETGLDAGKGIRAAVPEDASARWFNQFGLALLAAVLILAGLWLIFILLG